MVQFGHTGVGIAVGLTTYHYLGDINPALTLISAGAAGVVSHYLADLIPHGHFFKYKDYKSKVWLVIVFDLIMSVLATALTSFYKFDLSLLTWSILFGVGGSQLPDIVAGFTHMGWVKKVGILKAEDYIHNSTHWHGKLHQALDWDFKRDIYQVIIFITGLLTILFWK